MTFEKEQAFTAARRDLAKRLSVKEAEVSGTVEPAEFPDMALGAGLADEMSGQMITSGWRILLQVNGKGYEYRANKNQVRLFDYKGKNYRVG